MKKKFVIFFSTIFVIFVCFIISIFIPLNENDFRKENVHSLKFFDRNGKLLREYLNDEQGRGEWIPFRDISPYSIDAIVITEDKSFYTHPGIDPFAIARALYQNLTSPELSGGSTITQQLIRNVYHHPRTITFKVLEAWYALRLERMMPKEEILVQYLNRAPFGNQLNGIQAASKYYFDKPAKELSIAEAAFLAALPNSPTHLNPYKNYTEAIKRQKKILRKLFDSKKIQLEEYNRAIVQPIPIVTPDKKFFAPHAVEMIYAQFGDKAGLSSINTTIDLELQNDIQWIIKGHLKQLEKKKVSNSAVIVIHNATGEVRTFIGSSDYFNNSISGKFNGATALRQPGSALKPFTYGIALESGFTTSSLLADVPTSIQSEGGNYVPENYDREYHGPVRLRVALACSYNIPAVRILHSLGGDALYQRLMLAGIMTLDKSPTHYGFGLTLGNAEVSLMELTNAYRVFANQGMWLPIKLIRSSFDIENRIVNRAISTEEGSERQIFQQDVAYLITDILSDHSARKPAFGNHFHFSFPCAVKTGTTKDYKDNWTIGYTPEYTVGVWVGNFDGTPMVQVSGVTGAGQIFTDVMNLIMTKYFHKENHFEKPTNIVQKTVCARSGQLPNESCDKTIQEIFLKRHLPKEPCSVHKKYFVKNKNGKYIKQVFESFGPEYDEWCEIENIPKPRLSTPISDLFRTRDKEFVITYPHSGEIFKIDPVLRKEFQRIKVEALYPEKYSKICLILDRKDTLSFKKDGLWWELAKGEHLFHLLASNNRKRIKSNEVRFFVE